MSPIHHARSAGTVALEETVPARRRLVTPIDALSAVLQIAGPMISATALFSSLMAGDHYTYAGGIMGTMTSFPGMRGGTVQGYSSQPGEGKGPAVVVIQEWWGVQGQVKAVCDRLALMGFNALAPDLYGGKVIPYHDQAAASAAASSLDFKAAVENAVRGAVVHLKKSASKVGLLGFCMGGAVAVIGAARIPELDTAVSFYGLPPPNVVSAWRSSRGR